MSDQQTEHVSYEHAATDANLVSALDDEDRETIRKLAEVRGQTAGGVVKAGVKQIEDKYEGRTIEFANVGDARTYYRYHKRYALEFAGAYDELSPDEPYGTPAQPLHEVLNMKEAEHREKANAAARYLDDNDPENRVITNEYGSPEGIPSIDKTLEVQHGDE